MSRFRKGDYKVQCDKSGAIVYASQCRMQWNGLFVLKSLWTPRHPQETPSTITDTARPAITRSPGAVNIIEPQSVTAEDL